MSERQTRPVEKVAQWATGHSDLMREPVLTIRTIEGGDYAFQMPAQTARALAAALLEEAAKPGPSTAAH